MNIEIDRDKAAALRSELRSRSRARCTSAFGPQLGLHHLRAHQPVPGAAGDAAEVPGASPTTLSQDLLQDRHTAHLIPLDAVAKRQAGRRSADASTTPASLPSVTISFNLKPGVSLGEAVDEIEDAGQAQLCRPRITTSFQGTAKAFQDSLKNLSAAADHRDRWWSTSCWACCTKATSTR